MQQIRLDPWQQELKEYVLAGNDAALGKGRRVGGTQLAAEIGVDWIFTHKNNHPTSQVVCVSITESQAKLIIAFATNYAYAKYKKYIGKGKHKPTMTSITLIVNGQPRIFIAKPVGASGDSLRGYEAQLVLMDEVAFLPTLMFKAIMPMLATSNGVTFMWSTFNGVENFFHDQYNEWKKDPKEARFRFTIKTTEEVFRERECYSLWTEKKKADSLSYLLKEKKTMPINSFLQEYCAVAAVSQSQFFSEAWIDRVCNQERKMPNPEGYFYSGHDLARMGGDSIVHSIIEKRDNKYYHVENISKTYQIAPDIEREIYDLWRMWDLEKMGLDAGSGMIGCDILDHLVDKDNFDGLSLRNVIAMNNRRIIIDDDNATQKMSGEDMYHNMKAMGERGELFLLDDDEVKLSLRSVQMIFPKDDQKLNARPEFVGSYIHIAEALKRALLLAKKSKVINNQIASASQLL